MARKQIINGKVYDWSSVTIALSGCSGIEPVEISYGDEQEKNFIYGRGGRIRGYGTGAKKNSVKISLLREDFNTLLDAVRSKGFWNTVIPKVTVSYADEGCTTVTDTITNLTFSKRDFKAAEGDNSLKVDLEGIAVGGIAPDGVTK
jgi:hypothetical protein